MNYEKVCIIVPALNEEQSIAKVINSIRKVSKKLKIIVINDGSTDDTAKVATDLNCEVINLPFNLGVGGAVQTGLIYADNNNFQAAIQIDADGQHNPTDVPRLLKMLPYANIVIGSRFLKKTKYKTPINRMIAIRIFSKLIAFTSNFKVHDPTSGYKALDRKSINFLANQIFSESSDLLWLPKLIKNGYKIKEIPVEMNKRLSGESSFGPIFTIYMMVSISISILIESIKEKRGNKL